MPSQSKSPGFTWLIAVWPRSLHPAAARMPNPRSVKLRPLRTVRPTPSKGTHFSREVSTPPCRMRSSTRRPTALSASAVAIAVRRPKQRRKPASHVVLAAALPHLELACGVNAAFAGIKAKHHFAQAQAIPAARVSGIRIGSIAQSFNDTVSHRAAVDDAGRLAAGKSACMIDFLGRMNGTVRQRQKTREPAARAVKHGD